MGPEARDWSESDPLPDALDDFVDGLDDQDVRSLGGLLPQLEPDAKADRSTHLGGEFVIGKELGAGSSGAVFEARQRSVDDRSVAVKVLHRRVVQRLHLERFRREVATVGRIDHPNVVPIYASGEDCGTPYFAMKLVRGGSLAQLIASLRRRESQPRSAAELATLLPPQSRGEGTPAGLDTPYPSWVARLGFQLADALQAAHEVGVVHRDVKPGNVLLSSDGVPMLTDFGLALDEDDAELTETGAFLGTLAYASPEQVRGETVDTRSDVYSLGATLFELLSLERPFDASTRKELERKVLEERAPTLPTSVPRDLRGIVHRCLGKSPARRYSTPGEMARDLRAFLQGDPVRARPPGAVDRAWFWTRRHSRLAIVVAAIVATFATLRALDHLRARQAVHDGKAQLEQAERQLSDLRDRSRSLREHRDARAPIFGPDAFLDRSMRDELAAGDEEFDSLCESARSALARAFEHVAAYAPARRALADLYALQVHRSLDRADDLMRPKRLAGLEAQLRDHDDEARYAWLLDPRGELTLRVQGEGARIRVRAEGGSHTWEGDSGLALRDLPEGTYRVTASRPGHVTAELPVLVRRRACRVGPPTEQVVDCSLPEGQLPVGYALVPGGWTLVEDEPPRWVEVQTFLMATTEVTNGDWLEWMNAAPPVGPFVDTIDPNSSFGKPRFQGGGEGQTHFQFADGRWEAKPWCGLDVPVRGVTPMAFNLYATTKDSLLTSPASGWMSGLPTRNEWVRAARGADGRRFPWGDRFSPELSVSFLRVQEEGTFPSPEPVLAAPGDRSPFGVYDLAGSVRELCVDPHGPHRGLNAVCGGSYKSAESEELWTTRVESMSNQVQDDLGCRLVLRPTPASPRNPAAAFDEDFEWPDGSDLLPPWGAMAGVPGSYWLPNPALAMARVESGQLVIEGGSGNFAWTTTVYRPIQSSNRGIVVRGSIAAPPEGGTHPSAGIHLFSHVEHGDPAQLSLVFHSKGQAYDVRCALPGPGARHEETSRHLPLPDGGALQFELRLANRTLEAWVWTLGEDQPEEGAEVVLPRACDPLWFLALSTAPGMGHTLRIEALQFEVID